MFECHLQDILKQAMEDNMVSVSELPYFEGDFWPNILEESIKELDQEEEEQKKKEAVAAQEAANTVRIIFDIINTACITAFWGRKY